MFKQLFSKRFKTFNSIKKKFWRSTELGGSGVMAFALGNEFFRASLKLCEQKGNRCRNSSTSFFKGHIQKLVLKDLRGIDSMGWGHDILK